MKFRPMIAGFVIAGVIVETSHEGIIPSHHEHTHEEHTVFPQGRLTIAESTATSSVATFFVKAS